MSCCCCCTKDVEVDGGGWEGKEREQQVGDDAFHAYLQSADLIAITLLFHNNNNNSAPTGYYYYYYLN